LRSDIYYRFRKKIELYYPNLGALLGACLYFYFLPKKFHEVISNDKVINAIFTLSGVMFGFLLTILTILLQSSEKPFDLMKKYDRFKDLIDYNKGAVYSSGITLILSIIIIVYNSIQTVSTFVINSKSIIEFVLLFFIILMALRAYRYVDIFYSLIRQNQVEQHCKQTKDNKSQ